MFLKDDTGTCFVVELLIFIVAGVIFISYEYFVDSFAYGKKKLGAMLGFDSMSISSVELEGVKLFFTFIAWQLIRYLVRLFL